MKRSSLSRSQRWILAAVGLSSLMVASQNSALNAVLPVVAKAFGVDLASAQWVVLAYLIASGGLLLAFGRLGDMIGQRRLFLSGSLVFIAGSLLSSIAASLEWLVATRTLQAIGGGMITGAGAPLITKALPRTHRARALSVQIVMVYFGLAAGPVFGGLLADTLGWRWIFLVNVPLGLLAAAITAGAIAADDRPAVRQSFDLAGALAFIAALSSLFLLLGGAGAERARRADTSVLLLVFLAAFAAFVAIELKRSQPMLDLRLFKSRFFSAAAASAMINYMGFSALTLLVPFYLVDGMEYEARRAGAIITAMPLAMTLAAPLSGWLSDRLGPRIPASAGMSLLCAGIFFLGGRSAVSGGDIVPGLLLAGTGLGLFSSANNSAIMGAVGMNRQGVASGVVSSARQLGMMFGVALSTAAFRAHYADHAGLEEAGATAAAVRQAFLLISGVIGVGILTSLVRGAERRQTSPMG